MPQVLNFHCAWVPTDKCFRLSVGSPTHMVKPGIQKVSPQSWDLQPESFAEALRSAHSQLADATDATGEFYLDFPHGGITFNQGRDAFKAIIAYLQKIYDGWEKHWKRKK